MTEQQLLTAAEAVVSAFDGEGNGWCNHYVPKIVAILHRHLSAPASELPSERLKGLVNKWREGAGNEQRQDSLQELRSRDCDQIN